MDGLKYETAGDPGNPAILFLHGFMGSAKDWRAIMAALKERFYCVAADLPGHGASLGLPSKDYTIEGATRLLIGLLDELGIGRAILAGYSMGGRLALYLARRHPERCSGLFLESTSPGLTGEEERDTRRQADEEKAARLESGDFQKFLKDWYRQPIFDSLARDEKLLRETIEVRSSNDPAELARSLRGMGTGSQPPLWGELAGLPATMVVVGQLDEKFVGIGWCMEAEGPMVSFASVQEAGHNVHAESPRAYLDLLQSFFRSLPWQ